MHRIRLAALLVVGLLDSAAGGDQGDLAHGWELYRSGGAIDVTGRE